MPAAVGDVVNAAMHEWDHWGRSTWNLVSGAKRIAHRDDEADFARYVIDSYCAVGGGSPSANAIQRDDYAWSAVCVSAIMANAGHTRSEFPFAQGHSVWIRRFIRARRDGDGAALYWGFRVTEPAAGPEVGDVIAYARGPQMTFAQAQSFFDRTDWYPSHSDIVVGRRAREIDVIGGNVTDSVTMKTLALTPSGLLADRSFPWFAVLRRR